MAWRPADFLFCLNLVIIAAVFWLGQNGWEAADKKRAAVWEPYYNRSVKLWGRVCEEAEVSYNYRRLTVCTPAKVLVTTSLYPVYDYGDVLLLAGRLEAPTVFSDFDYPAYLARYGIYASLFYPRLVMTSGAPDYRQRAYRQVLDIKQGIRGIIERNLPEPEAGLAVAILLGYRRTLLESDLEIFSRTGLSHLIAISGSHISVLVALLLNFLLFLGFSRRQALVFVAVFLLAYPVFTGLSASAIRAALMGGFTFLAVSWGRPRVLIRLLVLAAALMLLANPRLLRSDLGFQLSFLSLVGLIYWQPLIKTILLKWLGRLAAARHVQLAVEAASLTLAAQFAVLPVILSAFKQLSLVAPLANILVAWTFAPLLAALIVGAFLSAVFPGGGLVWFWPAYCLLRLIFSLSYLMASFAWAARPVEGFSWSWGLAYYILLAALTVYFRRRKKGAQQKPLSRSRGEE